MEIEVDPSRLKTLVVGKTVFRSAYDYELSDSDFEKARTELNETEDLRKACLEDLKAKLSRDAIKYRTDDAYLLCFLRTKKFKCNEAYEMIKSHYSTRKKHPDIYCSLPSDLETRLNLNIYLLAPYRDEEGSIIFIDRIAKWKPADYTIYETLQLVQILIDTITLNPACQIHKAILIMDFKGATMSHISAALNPACLRLWLNTTQSMNPWRVKRIILFNCHKLGLLAFNTCRYLLKKKIADRIVVLDSDMNELHKYVNPVLLPKEYGGSLEESDCICTDTVLKNLPYIRYGYSYFNKK